jgi:hypothetical protein
VRERRRTAVALTIAVLMIGAASIWLWHNQWTGMVPNVPRPRFNSAGPGGIKLPEGLFIIADRMAQGGWLRSGGRLSDLVSYAEFVDTTFAGLLILTGLIAVRLAGDAKFTDAMDALGARDRECLTVGALLFCGCFLSGISVAYREVLLLFAMPALLSLQYRPGLSPFVRGTVWVAITLMWSLLSSRLVSLLFGGLSDDGGPIPTFAFWLVLEIAWWWLFAVLAATLLCSSELASIRVAAPRLAVEVPAQSLPVAPPEERPGMVTPELALSKQVLPVCSPPRP